MEFLTSMLQIQIQLQVLMWTKKITVVSVHYMYTVHVRANKKKTFVPEQKIL